MVNNIKTEIIYYCCPTDFEFEFNLCGACQMRLLTSTANDNASLLKSLQRSISRSRVIIIIGSISGQESVINLVSKSIGYSCEKIDTNVYDVSSEGDLLIVKDSVPLITDSGEFGGCIIESGPQSMIFLSDDKKIRKEIMTNLVHEYIKDLSAYPVQAAVNTDTAPIITQETEEEIEAIAETETQSEPEAEIEAEIDTVPEAEEEPEELTYEKNVDEPQPINPEDDPFNINNIFSDGGSEDIDFDLDNAIFYEDDDYEEPHLKTSNRGKALDIITLILSIILLLTLAFVVYSYIYLPLNNGISIEENFQNVFGFLIG